MGCLVRPGYVLLAQLHLAPWETRGLKSSPISRPMAEAAVALVEGQ